MKAFKSDGLVHSGLLKWAEAAPHRVALSFNGEAISFAELAQHCALIGAGRIHDDIRGRIRSRDAARSHSPARPRWWHRELRWRGSGRR